MKSHEISSAVISDCSNYRYQLRRKWGVGSEATFVMLNPSTADHMQDDATIRRCRNFAAREGCGGMVVVNLFAIRTVSPAIMKSSEDPVGPENDRMLEQVLTSADGPIVAAWGAHGSFRNRSKEVLQKFPCNWMAFGFTHSGEPLHPLRLPKNQPLIRLLT